MPMKAKTHRPSTSAPAVAHAMPRISAAKRGYGRQWEKRRGEILKRDHYICQDCNKPAGRSANVDHIKALAQGGTNDATNLQTLCHVCHSRKTAQQDGAFGRGRGAIFNGT